MKKFFALLGVQAVMLVLLSFGANTTAYSQDYETINPSGAGCFNGHIKVNLDTGLRKCKLGGKECMR
ncbi:MAG: hypothetical protein ACFCUI_13340 [Bernardetiaceae bacterium]